MKVYVVWEMGGGCSCCCDPACILGVYSTIEKALDKLILTPKERKKAEKDPLNYFNRYGPDIKEMVLDG